jgi:hypothetical protein
MLAQSDPRSTHVDLEDTYQRANSPRVLVRAIGIGLGVGLAAFYLARVFLSRPPLPSTALSRTRPHDA